MDSVRLVSWNVAGRHEPWRELVKMGVDVALPQETGRVPPDVASRVEVDPNEPWLKHQFSIWPKIVKLSDRVKVEWFKQVDPISETKSDEMSLAVRERSVFDRMEALGLKYSGAAVSGRSESGPNAGTLAGRYLQRTDLFSNRSSPAAAYVQLDHVFASVGFHEHVHVRALNEVDEWGPSDHCRVLIEVGALSTLDLVGVLRSLDERLRGSGPTRRSGGAP